MNNPLVSVVLSVYNGEQYLAEAIESILNQSYTNFELILVDDGSTDSSLEIIKSYDDKRIILISRENRGLIASLNEGILKAKGKYIARMDADDISLPTRFEEQVSFMESHQEVGICGTGVIVFGEGIKNYTWTLSSKDEILKAQLLFSSCLAHPSVMMRKELMIQHNLFYDKAFLHAEDFELWTRFIEYSKISNIKRPLFKYRILENSISRLADKDRMHRYKTIRNITQKYIYDLGIENSEKEYLLHFNLSTNASMNQSKIDFNELEAYFFKLVSANSEKQIFNEIELKKVLGKKWLINVYYRRKISAVFSKYIIYGVWSMLTK